MEDLDVLERNTRGFAIICVLGAPGAGKGTICTYLAQKYNLMHYSLGDGLRSWMRSNSNTQLASDIQDKLANQGFLPGHVLNPFIGRAIEDTIERDGPASGGILIDGYPRCTEQLESFDAWPLQDAFPLTLRKVDDTSNTVIPDIVLSLDVTRQNAEARYLGRGRDDNDKQEKFDKRFLEYKAETAPLEEVYRQRDVLIDLNANGTKDETIDEAVAKVGTSRLWQEIVVERQGRHVVTSKGAGS